MFLLKLLFMFETAWLIAWPDAEVSEALSLSAGASSRTHDLGRLNELACITTHPEQDHGPWFLSGGRFNGHIFIRPSRDLWADHIAEPSLEPAIMASLFSTILFKLLSKCIYILMVSSEVVLSALYCTIYKIRSNIV